MFVFSRSQQNNMFSDCSLISNISQVFCCSLGVPYPAMHPGQQSKNGIPGTVCVGTFLQLSPSSQIQLLCGKHQVTCPFSTAILYCSHMNLLSTFRPVWIFPQRLVLIIIIILFNINSPEQISSTAYMYNGSLDPSLMTLCLFTENILHKLSIFSHCLERETAVETDP